MKLKIKLHIALLAFIAILASGCTNALENNRTITQKEPEEPGYTVKIDMVTGGSVTVEPQKDSYSLGEYVKITATSQTGYNFVGWTGTRETEKNSYIFSIEKNEWIIPVFTRNGEPVYRAWTFIMYMAADNDLEAAAIADFNELEAIDFGGKPISILALLDRSAGYDATNGNWTDTRLYEINHDPNGNNATLISLRIDCPDLGLSINENTELDMSDPLVLQRLIAFAKREYIADNYGLIVWGHGTGWRGDGTTAGNVLEPMKAVAFDDYTGHYMSLADFGNAVSGSGLSVIGFDTCFAATLEVAYQLRDSGAQYMVGSAGMIPSNGWNYTELFNAFLTNPTFTVESLTNAVISQFAAQYSGVSTASISRIKLSEVKKLFEKFEAFTGSLAESITTAESQTIVRNTILNSVDSYYFNPPSDLYVDLYSFCSKLMSARNNITQDAALQKRINDTGIELQTAINGAVTAAWPSKTPKENRQIGVFFAGLIAPGVPEPRHSLDYTRGSNSMNKSAFVENSVHWVPNNTPSPASLLDKLFYLPY